MYPNISRINDKCLKNGFHLETNLSDVRGHGLIKLIDSLKLYSMQCPNMYIIERILMEHPQVFKTQESIKETMRKGDPVISAFTLLGKSDLNCTVRWLLVTLLKINEIHPVKNILATAPPYIKLLSCRPDSWIQPGEIIQVEIKTISKAQIQWWKNFKSRVEIIMDHIRIEEYSTSLVEYKTKDTDKGFIYLEVSCRGGFRAYSPQVYVDTEEMTYEDRKMHESCTNRMTEESSNFTGEELCEDIVPSRESDGIKRVALLVGIMNYNHSKFTAKNLKAPESDILDLERVLLQIGFIVYTFVDLDKRKMVHVLETFSKTYEDQNAYVFFYFAGHGNSSHMSDNINLIDIQMRVTDVLKTLLSKNPKVLVSIFDMCRDDVSEETKSNILEEATIAHAKNLVLVMSTLPKHKSYEKKNGLENTSLIMKKLCENLSSFSCKEQINIVLTKFVNSCPAYDQKPTISSVGITEIIGIDIPNRRIKPITEWLNVPKDRRLMSCVTVDFNIFHNILNIYINKSDHNIFKYTIQIVSGQLFNLTKGDIEDSYKISLFNAGVISENQSSIEFLFCVIRETPMLLKTDYRIKVHFPPIILPFLSLV